MHYTNAELPSFSGTHVVVVSGGFDPIHSGHIELIRRSSLVGDVIVLLNSDEWLTRKKGKPFLGWDERAAILRQLKGVMAVWPVKDEDGTVCKGIIDIRQQMPEYRIFFSNGGDRIRTTTPEVMLCEQLDIDLLWGMDNGRTKSSSKILEQYRNEEYCDKPWGNWTVVRSFPNVKVKTLTLNSGQKFSLQRHFYRSEDWFVLKGKGQYYNSISPYIGDVDGIFGFGKFDQIQIPVKNWHQLKNIGSEPLIILETQWGERCDEEDIERADHSNL